MLDINIRIWFESLEVWFEAIVSGFSIFLPLFVPSPVYTHFGRRVKKTRITFELQ
jgi:hypothetical protein